MTDDAPVHPLDQPVTAGALLDAAIAKTDLPKRGDLSWKDYLLQFENPEMLGRINAAVDAALKTDASALAHWVHQAESFWLTLQPRGKDPNRA